MSEVKKIATREGYGKALVELGKKDERIVVLDADLAAATKTGVFKKSVSGASYQLWYRRGKYDGNRGGAGGYGKDPVCKFFCHVCGGTCF